MAANMDALLRIATRVTGAEQVTALQGKFKQVEGAAQTLTSKMGPLGGALGALAPVATVGGLAALVGKTIEAGDKFNDLSQRTGVSVESLAKFNKAAATSGTDIDAVAKALGKLSKGLYETATTGKGATSDALKALGISAKDAAGNLKSADQVTLEIANKFKTMPDGVEKTALAMQLFGKSGAEMIPMLNEGGTAIESLSVKMNAAFAKKADEYNDKLAALGGKVGALASGITVALLPALDAVTTVLTAVVDGFTSLPGPIQAIAGGLALLAVSFAVLAPIVASVITVLGAFQGLAIGATIAGWLGALGPLTTALATFAATIVGWPLLIGAALVAVGVLIYAFRDDIGKVVAAIGKTIYGAVDTVNKTIRAGIGAAWGWLGERFNDLGKMLKTAYDGAVSIFGKLGDAVAQPFNAVVNVIKDSMRNVLQFIANGVNTAARLVNGIIAGYNRLPTPDLPFIPMVQVPSFEGGGYTGDAPRSGGLDGQGGFMAMLHPRETVIDHTRGGTSGGGVPNITIQTGQVLQMPDGSQWVSIGDLEQAMAATAAGVMAQLRSPAGRMALRGA